MIVQEKGQKFITDGDKKDVMTAKEFIGNTGIPYSSLKEAMNNNSKSNYYVRFYENTEGFIAVKRTTLID